MKALIQFILLLLFTTTLTAQNDTSGYYDVYRNETQQTLSPALTGDMGTHIIRSDIRFLKRTVDGDYHPLYFWQAAWNTTWRNHGFGIVSKNVPSNQLIASNTIGIQYAYSFGLGQKPFWKNSRLLLGTGINITQERVSNNLVLNDQIDTFGNIVSPSGEKKPSDKVMYPNMEAGLAFRSGRLYVVGTFVNLLSPQNGLYGTTTSELKPGMILQSGIKLVQWKKLATWLTLDARTEQHFPKTGLTLSYNHFMATVKIVGNNFSEINTYQLSYLSPRFRMYAQLERTARLTSSYHTHFISTGIAIGLTKQ